MATTPKVISYEEWLQMPLVTDAVEEVVNGEIRLLPPNKWVHAQIVRAIRVQLEAQLNPKQVHVMDTVFGLVIRREPLTTRVPGIAVFVLKNIVELDGYIHSAPELVVEVLSPANTRLERAEKIRDYASLGVPELWAVSPEARTVEVLQLDEEQKLTTTKIVNRESIEPIRFPHVKVDVESIWPR